MDNIEFFNRTTAALLRILLQKFPHPVAMFDTEKFRAAAALPANSEPQETEDIADVVKWLATEGYIRFREEGGLGQMFTQVVLTAKGLTAVGRVADTLTPRRPVAEWLKETSAGADAAVVSVLVNTMLDSTPPAS